MGPPRATTPAVAGRRRRATTAVDAQAKAYPLGRRRLCLGGNACARMRMHARGRQRLCPCDDGCRVGGVIFHKHPKLQCSGDDVYVRAITSAPVRQRVLCGRGIFSQTSQTSVLGRRRLRPGDNACVRATTSGSCFSNVGIFLCFGNPNKTFPLSLFENYSNCVEDGNPKLFLLVGVFLSALNRDLAFLSHLLSM